MALDTRKNILEQASLLFKDHGYNGTSMQMIAEAVPLKKASLYYYFKNKEGLYLEIVKDIMEQACTIFDRETDISFEKRVYLFLKLSQDRGALLFLVPTLSSQGNEKIHSQVVVFINLATKYLSTLSLRVSVRESLFVLLDISQSYARRQQKHGAPPGLSLKKYTQTLVTLLLR